jgi:hypothetical protein
MIDFGRQETELLHGTAGARLEAAIAAARKVEERLGTSRDTDDADTVYLRSGPANLRPRV